MRWSIVLPTHDSPATLGFAIDAALAQTDADFELIIVGDGVTDATRAVVADRDDPRIAFRDLEKGEGFGYEHRRVVLEAACGDYVAFMSDDDLVGPEHLRHLGALLDAGNTFAYSRPMWCVPSGQIVPLSVDLNDPWMREWFERANQIPSVCVAIRREALEAAGGWPVDVPVAADWTLWNRILALPAASVGYDSSATAIHFRSRRRDSDHPVVEVILALPDRDQWWPNAAAVSPGGSSQQAEVAAKDPDWWRELTRAAARIEHHVASSVSMIGPRLVQAEGSARAEQIRRYESTRSWRLTRPLRWLNRVVVAPGRRRRGSAA